MWSDADRSTSCVRFCSGYFHTIPVVEEVVLEQELLGSQSYGSIYAAVTLTTSVPTRTVEQDL